MTDPAAPRSQQPGGRDRLTYIDLRWPHLAAEPCGHYSELRQRLNNYADRLAAQIDRNPSDPFPERKARLKPKQLPQIAPRPEFAAFTLAGQIPCSVGQVACSVTALARGSHRKVRLMAL